MLNEMEHSVDLLSSSCAGCRAIDRRAFLQQTALAGVAAFLVGCTAGSDTQYAAFSLVCPHMGATVGIVGAGFRCPQHGARFAADGTWVGGQPTSNLRALTTQFNPATGTLTIT